MLATALIFFVCGFIFITLFRDMVGGIMSLKINTNPRWIGITLKAILSVIVSAFIIIGTLATALTMLSFTTTDKK